MLLNFGLGFLIKLVLIVICASFFYRKRHKIVESIVCGWLVIYVSLIGLLLVLSCFGAMNRIYLGVGGIIAAVIFLILGRRYDGKQCINTFFHDLRDKVHEANIISYIVVSGFFFVNVIYYWSQFSFL